MTQQTMGPTPPHLDAVRALAVGAAIVGAVAGVALTIAPDLDLVVARQFQLEGGGFAGAHSGPVLFLRALFKTIFIASCGAAVAGLLVVVLRRSRHWRMRSVHWLYLVVCLGVGRG